MVCLGETGVVFSAGQVSEGINQINGVTEENVVVHKNLLLFSLVRV